METVTGEDFIRLDWRVGVALEGWRARFRGVDVDGALCLLDFGGIVGVSVGEESEIEFLLADAALSKEFNSRPTFSLLGDRLDVTACGRVIA